MGRLTQEIMEKIGCAHKGYGLPYSEHTCDRVMALKLKRNGTNKEANEILLGIKDEVSNMDIDGFIFIETDEKYRIK
jgi:hypothetical protein